MAPNGSPFLETMATGFVFGWPTGGLRYEDGVFEKYNVKVLGHLT